MIRLMRARFNCDISFAVIGFALCVIFAVDGACPKTEKKLWAYTNPSTEHFSDSYKKYISSDRGELCRWVITTSNENHKIELKLSNFELKNSTKSDQGDCLEIYDGGQDKKKLEVLCDKFPQVSYTSTEAEIFIVYKRGDVEGNRRFSMTYSSHSVVSKEKIIQIAGLVGAILASIGLTYVVLRVTKCCKCLRKKESSETNITENATRERDRLMVNVNQVGENAEIIQTSTSQNSIQPSINTAVPPPVTQDSIAAIVTTSDNVHDSDIDSLTEMNELPPSYESLYLTELGESVAPPKYSPPQHLRTHPPRRVNTLN